MIDYKELQIWDWVRHKTLGTQQVSFLDSYGDIGLGMAGDNPYTEADIDPIPLTKEILLLNGFEENVKGSTIFWFPKTCIYIDLKYCKVDKMEIRNVHQMQHLLRLRGQYDLANGFKVE